ncbi:MAG TPA: methyl-accepting chemotaxis protein [Syntrophorhabdales bacterium]|nr:methyl-accepting chemotaxis protein [Syntrophorhabdales bacterium]
MKQLLGNMRIATRILTIPAAGAALMIAWRLACHGQTGFWIPAALFAVAAGLSFFVALSVARSILAPVRTLTMGIRAITDGDLTRRADIASNDEIGEAGRALNGFLDRLQETITQFAGSGAVVSGAAFTLDGATKRITENVEQTAQQVSSVATASEEMSSTSAEIARNCTSAAKSSEKANEAATKGESVIGETVKAMDRINGMVKTSAKIIEGLGNRSDQIGEVINLIDDIADQTNLLALNAAIEAARAGEHGRGFAVVADEVRKLAEKTTAATKDIGNTIKAMQSEAKQAVTSMDQGVKEVEVGAQAAEKSGKALKDILTQIHTVSGEIGQIAVASEQQTATVEEIASNIRQISDVIGGSAKSVGESSLAASEMAALSMELNKIASQYTLATCADAEELVEKAAAYMKTHGKERALAEINDPKGQFVRKGLFLLAGDLVGNVLAHGLEKGAIGKTFIGAKDAEGKAFVKETMNLAKAKGSGWVEFAIQNPVTKKIQRKLAHCRRVDDVVIMCDLNKAG